MTTNALKNQFYPAVLLHGCCGTHAHAEAACSQENMRSRVVLCQKCAARTPLPSSLSLADVQQTWRAGLSTSHQVSADVSTLAQYYPTLRHGPSQPVSSRLAAASPTCCGGGGPLVRVLRQLSLLGRLWHVRLPCLFRRRRVDECLVDPAERLQSMHSAAQQLLCVLVRSLWTVKHRNEVARGTQRSCTDNRCS